MDNKDKNNQESQNNNNQNHFLEIGPIARKKRHICLNILEEILFRFKQAMFLDTAYI
jgi:hypothetical protein